MTIYLSHSRKFDYAKGLYNVIKSSNLSDRYHFVFPHENSQEPYDSKELFFSGKCDLVIAECTYPSTGQGIELGWADANSIPVICLHKSGKSITRSLAKISKNIFDYPSSDDLISVINKALKKI